MAATPAWLTRVQSAVEAVESVLGTVSPSWALKRTAARAQLERATRGYKAASKGRRVGENWQAIFGGAERPTDSVAELDVLRSRARELLRNQPYWKQARRAIVHAVVGHGIRAVAVSENERRRKAVQSAWDEWAKSNLPDMTGDNDLYGLQSLAMRHVVDDGECLVVRRMEGATLRLQLLGAEWLSNANDGELQNGGEILGGVETDAWGRRVAYHLHKRHPARGGANTDTVRILAQDVAHVFLQERAGQLRGVSWVDVVLSRLVDWDDIEDAELMKQKIAACFGAVYTGVTADDGDHDSHDKIQPGMIEHLPNGAQVHTLTPPSASQLRDVALVAHRGIATGAGITYEALTGDYSNVNYSSARMGRLQMHANVSDWQQKIMVDRMLERVWAWFVQAHSLSRSAVVEPGMLGVTSEWTFPSQPLIDPEKDNRADKIAVRAGFKSWSRAVRERGLDPRVVAEEIAGDQKMFDELGIVLDIDPRHVSEQGQGSVNQKQEEGASDGGTDEDEKQAT